MLHDLKPPRVFQVPPTTLGCLILRVMLRSCLTTLQINLAFLQEVLGLVGYWRVFIPHLTQILKPLCYLVQKGIRWGWHETCAFISAVAKWTVKAVKALSETDPSGPCELDAHVTEDGWGWGLSSTL